MAIAKLAVATAEGIALHAYPRPITAQLRAHAWKDLGKALRFLGRNREALDAFDTAEDQIERYDVLAHRGFAVKSLRHGAHARHG